MLHRILLCRFTKHAPTGRIICVVTILASIFALSYGVYHRSFVATVVEIYMNIIDREAMYAVYAENPVTPVAYARESNPAAIEKELREAPLSEARKCKNGCGLLLFIRTRYAGISFQRAGRH